MAPSYASMASSLVERNAITSQVDQIKATLSSWDSCMSKTYCKWPVIAVIIVASLIVLLVVTSIARCLCCGVECCCGCLACCNACCPSPRGRRSGDTKYVPANQPAYQPPPQYPYQPQAGMNYGAPLPAPQFATFDASSRNKAGGAIHEDALPPMPSWETAQSRRVMHDDDDTEYHGASGEQENGDIALGGMNNAAATSLQQHYEQRQPMLQPTSPTYHTSYQDHQEPAASGYPYQTQGAYAGGDLGGQSVPSRQQPMRHDSTYSAAPTYRTQATSPSPYAHGYGNSYAQPQHSGANDSYYNSFNNPSSTAYGGAPARQVRFGEEPAADLFYPTPAAPMPTRRPVGGGNHNDPSWI